MSESSSPKLATGKPVPSFDMYFQWHEGDWAWIFDQNVNLIQLDVLRALAGDKMVVYLSCPISSRGGSFSNTNVEIAEFTAAQLISQWGPRFWILNPSSYQLASKQGTGLIVQHAKRATESGGVGHPIDVDKLQRDQPPAGGDYMRMWTRVLVEDGNQDVGGRFSAFYFLGPSDARAFFLRDGAQSVSAGVEEYFARKFATDPDFNFYFSPPFKSEDGKAISKDAEAAEWNRRRAEFIRFYTVRASIYYSLGSHDEWNIWCELNRRRREIPALGISAAIAGYYDGVQVAAGAAEQKISRGYSVTPAEPHPIALQPVRESIHRSAAIDALSRPPQAS